MPTNSNQNNPNNDEIDLLTLFAKLGEFIKKAVLGLIDFIGAVLVFLLRKWYYFIIAVVLSILTALIMKNTVEPYYYTDLVLRSNAAHNQSIMSSLNKLGEYASEGNFSFLSKELDLSLEEASSIKGLETFWYYDIGDDGIYDGIDTEGLFLSDTNVIKIEDEFVLRVAIFDPDILQNFEEGLLHYVETNPVYQALNKQRLSNLQARIIQTQYEIEKLDSLQKREYYANSDNLRQKDGQIVFTSEKVVQTYHNDMFRLLKMKQDYETELNVYSGVVTVMEGFAVPVEPDNGSLKYLREALWIYLGLALLAALIIKFRKKIWAGK